MTFGSKMRFKNPNTISKGLRKSAVNSRNRDMENSRSKVKSAYEVDDLKRLLENFDLEKTLDRCRNMDSIELDLHSTRDLSINGQYHLKRVSKNLKECTGLERAYINNAHFIKTLEEAKEQQKEAELIKRYKQLEELESSRMRNLLNDGRITAEEFYESYPSCKDYVQSNSKNNSLKPLFGKTHMKKLSTHHERKINKIQKKKPVNHQDDINHEDVFAFSNSPNNYIIPIYLKKRSSFSSSNTKDPPKDLDIESDKDSQLDNHTEHDEKDIMTTSPEKERKSEKLNKLWAEETVDGMYRIANEIIPECRPRNYTLSKSTINVTPQKRSNHLP